VVSRYSVCGYYLMLRTMTDAARLAVKRQHISCHNGAYQ
jgi:hypothetical protein